MNFIRINAVFSVAEMVIMAYLFKSVFTKKWIRDLVNLALVSFISVLITLYIVKGFSQSINGVQIAQGIFLILLSVTALWQVITNEQVTVFNSPMFWIAGGTLCYYMMYLLAEAIKTYESRTTQNSEAERMLLLHSVFMVRYLFYIVATFVAPKENKENKSIG